LGPFRNVLEKNFGSKNFGSVDKPLYLEFNIGGSTGVDIFPKGWNKTYGYYFMKKLTSSGKIIDITNATPESEHPITDTFNHVLFFGDQALSKVGNDYEVCKAMQNVENDLCIPVKNPEETINRLQEILREGVSEYINKHKDEFKTHFSNYTKVNHSGGSKRKSKKSKRKSKKSKRKSKKSKRAKRKSQTTKRHTKSKFMKFKKSKINLDRVSHGAYMTSDFKV
jgi:hypothetical protein